MQRCLVCGPEHRSSSHSHSSLSTTPRMQADSVSAAQASAKRVSLTKDPTRCARAGVKYSVALPMLAMLAAITARSMPCAPLFAYWRLLARIGGKSAGRRGTTSQARLVTVDESLHSCGAGTPTLDRTSSDGASTKPTGHDWRVTMARLRLELQDISKAYPGVRANDGVCLRVAEGEIHAVLGENGAGKSTLMKIIYGVVQPDSGRMLWQGEPVRVASPEHARRLGISMVFQHFSLFESLTVTENVWLGVHEKSRARVAARIRELCQSYGLEVEPDRPVHTLSVGERQRVEIVRALLSEPKLLILDEPTSVLTPQAVTDLFNTLRRLAKDGCSILYISHKLDEIRALCDSCTVLRAGKVTGEVAKPANESNASLSRLMIGAEPAHLEHRPFAPGPALLEVKELTRAKPSEYGVALHGITFSVRSGEVLGIAGVSGNGQAELLAALSGESSQRGRGSLSLLGNDVTRAGPTRRRELGLHFVPEERLGRATVPSHSLSNNVLLTRRATLPPSWLLQTKPLRRLAKHLIERFSVKASGPSAAARSLSGGNLQKYVVGREIDAAPRVLIVAQPTWGVDVGATAQIRAEILKLRDAGSAVLLVSEELDELLELSDTVRVMAAGRVSPPLLTAEATRSLIGEWMSGLWPDESGHNPQEARA
jgi:general nucleoside transport system ATP-binding protein